MSYLRSFAPWIAYVAMSIVVDWRAATVVALVVAVGTITDQRRRHGDVDDLTRATAWFFFGLTALSLLDPTTPLHRYTPALSLAALGVASVASLIRRQPFTLTIARRSAPPVFWDAPAFIHANVTITTVWAASFLATAAVCTATLALAPSATPLWITAEVLGFVIPMKFTALYRERARARFATAA
jgi:hypothetical protein